MGKLKKKSHSAEEHSRGIIRELKKRIKELEQELRSYKKRENLYENNKDEIQEILEREEAVVEKVAKCPECHEGELKLILDFPDKDIFSCSECEFRKVVKK